MTNETDRNLGLALCVVVAVAAGALMAKAVVDLNKADFTTIEDSDMTAGESLVGEPAPDFSLENIEGEEVALEDFGDDVLMVNFWATWCGPCIDEMPTLVQLHSLYANRGFSVVGISVDDSAEKVRTFAPKHDLNYPLLMVDAEMRQDYGGISAIPTTFMIDKKGVVRFVELGRPSDLLVFQKRIEELLQE